MKYQCVECGILAQESVSGRCATCNGLLIKRKGRYDFSDWLPILALALLATVFGGGLIWLEYLAGATDDPTVQIRISPASLAKDGTDCIASFWIGSDSPRKLEHLLLDLRLYRQPAHGRSEPMIAHMEQLELNNLEGQVDQLVAIRVPNIQRHELLGWVCFVAEARLAEERLNYSVSVRTSNSRSHPMPHWFPAAMTAHEQPEGPFEVEIFVAE